MFPFISDMTVITRLKIHLPQQNGFIGETRWEYGFIMYSFCSMFLCKWFVSGMFFQAFLMQLRCGVNALLPSKYLAFPQMSVSFQRSLNSSPLLVNNNSFCQALMWPFSLLILNVTEIFNSYSNLQ